MHARLPKPASDEALRRGIRVEVLDASVAPMMAFLFDPPDA